MNCLVDDLLISEKAPARVEVGDTKKKKGGIAPLIDEIEIRFPKEIYPSIYELLKTYLLARIQCRKAPTLEKWQQMLSDLEKYSMMKLSGTEGAKLNRGYATKIIEKAIQGKNGIPFPEFENLFGAKENVMEPQFDLNQEFTKGY